MIEVIKLVLVFVIFFHIIRYISNNLFPLVEGICVNDGEELSGITKDECSVGGFTWNEPGQASAAADAVADTGEDKPVEIIQSNIPESDNSRVRRLSKEAEGEQKNKNVAMGSLFLSCCSSWCCYCCCFILLFLPMLIPRR